MIVIAILKEALNKSPRTSGRKIFRPAALKNLEIHQVFLHFLPCRAKYFLLHPHTLIESVIPSFYFRFIGQ